MEHCSSCPSEVVWEAVDSDRLFRHPKILSVHFQEGTKVRLPAHLQSEQETIRAFSIRIEFVSDSTLEDVDAYIRRAGESIFDSNTAHTCWGTLYRRSSQKGYWTLRAPCLSCYLRLLETATSDEALKLVILSSL